MTKHIPIVLSGVLSTKAEMNARMTFNLSANVYTITYAPGPDEPQADRGAKVTLAVLLNFMGYELRHPDGRTVEIDLRPAIEAAMKALFGGEGVPSALDNPHGL